MLTRAMNFKNKLLGCIVTRLIMVTVSKAMILHMGVLDMTIETTDTVVCQGKTVLNKWQLRMALIPISKGMEV